MCSRPDPVVLDRVGAGWVTVRFEGCDNPYVVQLFLEPLFTAVADAYDLWCHARGIEVPNPRVVSDLGDPESDPLRARTELLEIGEERGYVLLRVHIREQKSARVVTRVHDGYDEPSLG